MDDPAKAAEESAKAVQEVAKATGKAIGAAESLGGFLAQFVRGPLEQASGILEDKLKLLRWERRLRLMQCASERMIELGMKHPTRMLPLNFALPLLEAASLEENDELQDMWVDLLLNSADADYKVEVRRSFISILQDFGSLEARIMTTIYSRSDLDSVGGFWTRRLPDQVETVQPPEDDTNPSPEVGLALDNLVRLNCLSSAMMWDGPLLLVPCVYPTALGKALYSACAHRPPKAQ